MCNRVITDSRVMQENYGKDLNQETVFIPYGSEIGRNGNKEWIRNFELESNEYMLFVGRLVPENSAHHLVRAFREIKTDYKLVLVGDAPYSNKYKKELKALADERVIFTGYVFGEGYKSLSSHAYCFVLPSRIDGTRPVLLEQLGFGNCVVVSNSPGNLEVIGDSGIQFDGTVSDLKEKLEELIAHPETVEKYRGLGPERIAKRYDWERITDEYEKLFCELVVKGARYGMRDAR